MFSRSYSLVPRSAANGNDDLTAGNFCYFALPVRAGHGMRIRKASIGVDVLHVLLHHLRSVAKVERADVVLDVLNHFLPIKRRRRVRVRFGHGGTPAHRPGVAHRLARVEDYIEDVPAPH